MKTTSFVSTAVLVIAHGLTASALIISPSNFERTGASLEPMYVTGNDTADSADQNRPGEKQSRALKINWIRTKARLSLNKISIRE